MTVGPAMDMPIMHDSDRYDFVRDIGSGNFGVARLMRDRQTRELVAVKYIERGNKVNFGISFSIGVLIDFCNIHLWKFWVSLLFSYFARFGLAFFSRGCYYAYLFSF